MQYVLAIRLEKHHKLRVILIYPSYPRPSDCAFQISGWKHWLLQLNRIIYLGSSACLLESYNVFFFYLIWFNFWLFLSSENWFLFALPTIFLTIWLVQLFGWQPLQSNNHALSDHLSLSIWHLFCNYHYQVPVRGAIPRTADLIRRWHRYRSKNKQVQNTKYSNEQYKTATQGHVSKVY